MRFDNTGGDVCACVPSMQNRLPMLQEDDGGEGQNHDKRVWPQLHYRDNDGDTYIYIINDDIATAAWCKESLTKHNK